MRIACLGWGSLLWNPGHLPLDGGWEDDGPPLPIEFARVGDKGELATVLCPGAPFHPSWWARLTLDDLDEAVRRLREREAIPADRADGVGCLIRAARPAPDVLGGEAIRDWLALRDDLDAVVWTSLPPRYAGEEGRVPSHEEAVAHLRDLDGDRRHHAHDYARRVPRRLRTPVRDAIEAVLDPP